MKQHRLNLITARQNLLRLLNLTCSSYEEWRKTIDSIEKCEQRIRDLELATGEEMCLRHGWKEDFRPLDHKRDITTCGPGTEEKLAAVRFQFTFTPDGKPFSMGLI